MSRQTSSKAVTARAPSRRPRGHTVDGPPMTPLSATGGVITSAGAVLAGTFAALSTLPVTFLAEIGFAVAFGVLLDTLVVRSVLVTALNLDLGRWVWWPSALFRHSAPDRETLDEQAEAVTPSAG